MNEKTLIVRVSPDLARHLAAPVPKQGHAQAFCRAVKQAGGTLAPIDPQTGPHYLDVVLPASGDIDRLARALRDIEGVDTAFVKPDVELP